MGRGQGGAGENGTVTGRDCPKGLYGTFCEVCFTFLRYYSSLYMFVALSHAFYVLYDVRWCLT